MSKEDAIVLKNIGMKFNLSKEKVDSLKDYVIQCYAIRSNIMNFGH